MPHGSSRTGAGGLAERQLRRVRATADGPRRTLFSPPHPLKVPSGKKCASQTHFSPRSGRWVAQWEEMRPLARPTEPARAAHHSLTCGSDARRPARGVVEPKHLAAADALAGELGV